MIKFLFLDLDDTILDFRKAEHIALHKTFRAFGLEPTDEVCALYSKINRDHWEKLERKELTRPQVLVGRFQVLFEQLGVQAEPEQVAACYENNLSVGHYFLPGAEETLELLSKTYPLYLASNGTAKVQAGRLRSANISRFFKGIFVSQEIGADKPSKEYFDRCFATIAGFAPEEGLMVGDSLTSDIRGGRDAGMVTCWVNTRHCPAREDIVPDYEIECFSQLPDLLNRL